MISARCHCGRVIASSRTRCARCSKRTSGVAHLNNTIDIGTKRRTVDVTGAKQTTLVEHCGESTTTVEFGTPLTQPLTPESVGTSESEESFEAGGIVFGGFIESDTDDDTNAEIPIVDYVPAGEIGEFGSSGESEEDITSSSISSADEVEYTVERPCPVLNEYSVVTNIGFEVCMNCHRSKCDGFDGLEAYAVKLYKVATGDIRFKLKKNLTFSKGQCQNGHALLCGQCTEVVTASAQQRRGNASVGWRFIWPSYCWVVLTSCLDAGGYGAEILSLLPVQWHGYWIAELHRLYCSVFPHQALSEYSKFVDTVVVDVTLMRQKLVTAGKNLRLGEMKTVCDALLLPVVLCPWGCSCYAHDKGSIAFDAVFHRFFAGAKDTGTYHRKDVYERMESCREDFLSEKIDMHLFNPSWKVRPSVYYSGERGPVFCCCLEHNGGSKEKYFHLPKTGASLPSRHAECLSPAVLRTRTLRPTKPQKYSNSYRLQKCYATYCGIDTAVISENRYFDYHSHIDALAEARSFAFRDDIKGVAAALQTSGELSIEYVQDLAVNGERLFGEVDESEMKGATMLLLSDAIKLQKVLTTSAVTTVVDFETNTELRFRANWPPVLLRLHTCNQYGAKMPEIPLMQSRKQKGVEGVCLRSLWFLSTVVVGVPEVWECLCAGLRYKGDWQGYLLSYLATYVTKEKYGRDHRNPFTKRLGEQKEDQSGEKKPDYRKPKNLSSLVFGGTQAEFPRCIASAFAGGLALGSCTVQVIDGTVDLQTTVQVLRGTAHDCKSIFVICSGIDGQDLPTMVSVDSAQFELRLCGYSRPTADPTKPNQWSGEVWRKHGGSFTGWWRTRREFRDVNTVKQEVLDAGPISFAVYAAVDSASLCKWRRDYLEYIGGQKRVFCGDHDIPLITSALARRKGGRLCCCLIDGAYCTAIGVYECPARSCNNAICKKCWSNTSCDTFMCVFSSDERSLDESNGVHDDSGCSNCSASHETCTVGHDNDDLSSTATDEAEGELEFAGLHTGRDVSMFDLEHQLPTERGLDYEGDEYEPLVPTTLRGATADMYNRKLETMGTSVLLNKFGTVLVRKDNRLQASRREKNLVERVVSRNDKGSIPLLYLEGMLFPSIFWSQPNAAKGGLLGSIPTALFCQHATRRKYNIASLASHAKVRLKAIGNTAGTNPGYLSFLFDCLANGALEGNDTRVVLSRGFEEAMGPAGMRMRNGEDDFYTDTIDNRQVCHNLCASEKDRPSSLFVTLTCNQREHFGVRTVKRYADSKESLDNYKLYLKSRFDDDIALTAAQETEVAFSIQEAARNLIVRNWMEVRLLLIRYLLKSPEQPVGKVLKIFVRDEYQSESGNLSHLHILLCLAEGYNTVEGRRKIETAIRGFLDEIVGLDEVEACIHEGIFESWEDFQQMKEQASRILPHHCDSHRCLRRVGPDSNELRCRVPDTRKLSGDLHCFSERKIDVLHSSDALQLYETMGMIRDRKVSGGSYVPVSGFLDAKRILAPARFGEGNITPVLGKLFAATRSSMNVQVCTSFGTSRYLVKYLTKIDENNYVVFSVRQDNPSEYKVELVNLHNTKITSSAINEKKKLNASRNKSRPRGRAIASTEMMQIILGYPQVYTNVKYIKVPSLPLGDRSGVERKSPQERYTELEKKGVKLPDLLDFGAPSVRARKALFRGNANAYRRFTRSQEILLEDQLQSPVSIDRVTVFGGRPPELLLIDKMDWYFRYFERGNVNLLSSEVGLDTQVSRNLDNSKWIDGFGHRIRLLPSAIPVLKKLLEGDDFDDASVPAQYMPMLTLLRDVCEYYTVAGLTLHCNDDCVLTRVENLRWKKLQECIIAGEKEHEYLPIPVFSNVRPKNATKFVIHVLLSLGRFQTESDLWACRTMKEAFVMARLLHVSNTAAITEQTCLLMLKRWIEEQLQFYPISSKIMDDYVCSANSIFRSVLLRNEIPTNELPPCLYVKVKQDVSDKTKQYLHDIKRSVTEATLRGLRPAYAGSTFNLPGVAEIVDAAAPFGTTLRFPKSPKQSSESFTEQEQVYIAATAALDKYMVPSTVSTKNLVIVGPPGAGKTHCLQLAVLYGLCQKLCCITTAMLAERALLLGGQHFHRLFKIRAKEGKYRVHRLAELAVIALQRFPEALALLRALDVLFVDEMGQLSAELLSVLDIILRRVRDSSLFMGGLLVIGTMDQAQLRPIKELPFLLSPYILTCFDMVALRCYVRCAECPILQEMNDIARFYTTDESIKQELLSQFRTLLSANCTFVSTWDDEAITDVVLRVFPKKRQVEMATKTFLTKKKANVLKEGGVYLTAMANDTMVPLESHGDWCPASPAVVAYLNRIANEPDRLDFFVGALYQFTFNSPGKFSTTQLGVLTDMPSRNDLESHRPIQLMAAPAGTKVANIDGLDKQALFNLGWREVLVSIAPEYTQTLWHQGYKAKRRQYGLKHHIASTVHAAIGHTMLKVATELCKSNGVWERAMVVVLISRVKHAKDIILVGNKEENIDALVAGLELRCQYDEYMNHIVSVLTGERTDPLMSTVSLEQHPYRPRDIPLPLDVSGVVYLLVSMQDGSSLYVGFTQNLGRRLKQHNSGYGAKTTSDATLRPWALAAYVCGFEGDRRTLHNFELDWQHRNQHYRPGSITASVNLAKELVELPRYSDKQLVMVVAT